MITPKNFWLWFGGIVALALAIPFVAAAVPEPQTQRRPESSTTPMSSQEEEITLLLYQHAPNGTGHTYCTHWYEGNDLMIS